MKIPLTEIGFILGSLSIILVLISGPGTRIGIYPFTAGLLILSAGSLTGLAAIITSILKLSSGSQNPGWTFAGLIFGMLTFGLLVVSILGASNSPMIHDITTDTANPPRFESVLPLRKGAINPAEYGGKDTADKQISAYPDIKSMHLNTTPEKAFDKALKAAESLKWSIIDQKRYEGRIEAYDTTFWFGFKDDIVIRIAPENKGTIVDIRSLSRVGMGDMGTNAKRVRMFIKLMSS